MASSTSRPAHSTGFHPGAGRQRHRGSCRRLDRRTGLRGCGRLGTSRLGIVAGRRESFCSQLRSGRLFEVVSSALQKHGRSPDKLELEITENTVLRHSNQSTKALRKLRALGVGIAFDDFNTGFASLSLLQKYPLSRLKIDRSFVARVDRKVGDAAIVKAIVSMAGSLGLEVIAEGVETAEQEATLMRLGCEEAQGFRDGRPMPAAEIIEAYLYRNTRRLAGTMGLK